MDNGSWMRRRVGSDAEETMNAPYEKISADVLVYTADRTKRAKKEAARVEKMSKRGLTRKLFLSTP